MKNKSTILAAALMPLFSYAAIADDTGPCCRAGGTPNWYAGVSGGVVFLSDITFGHSVPYSFQDFQTYRPGYTLGGQFGYRIYPNIRGELEIVTQTSDVKTDPGTPIGNGARTSSATAFMANLYYDWHYFKSFTPYIGAGLGEADVKTNRAYTLDPADNPPTQFTKVVQGWAPAHEFLTGVNFDFNMGMTPFELGLGYRYLATNQLKVTLAQFPGTIDFPYTSQSLELNGKIFF